MGGSTDNPWLDMSSSLLKLEVDTWGLLCNSLCFFMCLKFSIIKYKKKTNKQTYEKAWKRLQLAQNFLSFLSFLCYFPSRAGVLKL